jgi:uncharacterized coiled-coil protein SlyX
MHPALTVLSCCRVHQRRALQRLTDEVAAKTQQCDAMSSELRTVAAQLEVWLPAHHRCDRCSDPVPPQWTSPCRIDDVRE